MSGGLDHCRVVQQADASDLAEALTDQEIPVPGHEGHFRTLVDQRAKTLTHAGVERCVDIVITGPVLEEVTQYEQSLSRGGSPGQKSEKRPNGVGRFGGQVQVRNEDVVNGGIQTLRPLPRVR